MVMYNNDYELEEIPFDNWVLKGVEETMGSMPTPGDLYDNLREDEDGEPLPWTEEQQDALDEYEQYYYRWMEKATELIESFGYVAIHGIH